MESRLIKLKFKDDLVDYEPDTEDDVNSIESYNEVLDYSIIEKETRKPLEESEPINVDLNLFTDVAMEEENTEDEVEEDLVEEVEYETKITSDDNFEPPILDHKLNLEESVEEIEEDDSFNLQIETSTNSNNIKTPKTTSSRISTSKRKMMNNYHINCKDHCIDRLDVNLNLSINKLHITEKPCPMLKLQRRNCCEKNPVKIDQKLPLYAGHKSEYGLSLEQLEKRERRRQIIKLREQKRQEVLEEYQQRKIQQNEEIFCQWLKNVSKRKRESDTREKKTTKCLTPTVFPFPNKTNDKIKERPKTAHFVPTHAVKKVKRPHTSSSCVFIEVPQNLLRKGISVGDILVRNSNNIGPNIHFLTIS